MACQNACKRCDSCQYWQELSEDMGICELLNYWAGTAWVCCSADPGEITTPRNFGCVLHEKISLAQVDPDDYQERDHG